MAGHAQSKIGMTECSKTQIRLTGLINSVKRLLMFMMCSMCGSFENEINNKKSLPTEDKIISFCFDKCKCLFSVFF